MSTIKISQLQQIDTLNSNTSNTIFVGVDLPTGITGKFTATTIAQKLYLHNPLNVGNNEILFPSTVAQFSGEGSEYLQLNMQNFSSTGSGDIVITADNGTNSNAFIDMGINGSAFNNPAYSSMKVNDGYIFVTGPDSATAVGNLVLGAASSGANINFAVGGYEESNIVATISKSGLSFVSGNVTFIDGSTQSTAAAPAQFTQDAYNTANNIGINLGTANTWLQANDLVTLTSSRSYTDTANSYIQNHYLANTTGTFSGDLTITGNTNMHNSLHVHNSSMPGNTQYLLVTGTANGAISTPSNPGYTIHTAVDTGNRIVAEAYGSGLSDYSAFISRRGRGTAELPSAVQNGDIIMRLGGNGYGSTKFSQFSDARIEFVATETHTDISKGTQIQFWTTTSGSNTASQIGIMNGNTVTFTGTVQPQKGFIFTPNVSGTLTAKTIDFSRDSLLKFDVNTDATITLSNYVSGKLVETWITNSAAQNKIITHGCLANNSTSKSTTFTILSNSCAYLRYMSVDGDLANTFVTITA